MKKRRERQEQFKNSHPGVYGALYPALLSSSEALLEKALEHRRSKTTRTTNNHYAPYAVGSIVLLVDGLEAWLNQCIWYYSVYEASDSFRDSLLKLADEGIIRKYRGLPRRIINVELTPDASLEVVIELRNEMAHFLPRIVDEDQKPSRHVPPWFKELYDERLFFVPEHRLPESTEFPLDQLLSSYRLAYWAWKNVAEAVKVFCEALLNRPSAILLQAYNFELYKNHCPPSQLPQYDARHGLSLT